MHRVEWKIKVVKAIETQAEVGKSEAQSYVESNEDLLNECWSDGKDPEETASILLSQ